MFRGYLIAAIGFGLICTEALAQEDSPPASVPIQIESRSDRVEATPALDNTKPLLSAIQGIEAAIRELVPKENQEDRNLQEELARRDLLAQEDMAQWALWMFVAAAVSVILTFVGVLLLRSTLIYTRDAAKSAAEAVTQAKEATAAALAAVDETKRIGEAQVRAYCRITHGSVRMEFGAPNIVDRRRRPVISIDVRNYGQSPAQGFKWSVLLKYCPPYGNEFVGSLEFWDDAPGDDIGAGETKTLRVKWGDGVFTDEMEAIALKTNCSIQMDIVIKYAFKDVFGNTIEDDRVFHTFFKVGGLDGDSPLEPHFFTKEVLLGGAVTPP